MNTKDKLLQYMQQNDSDSRYKITQIKIHEVIQYLDFLSLIKLAWILVVTGIDDSKYEQTEYGIDLILLIQKTFPEKWNQDWKYDAMLGELCDLTHRYESRNQAYLHAYEKEKNHPGLLIALARCYTPKPQAITIEKALQLVQQAMQSEMYLDGAWLLSQIYYTKKNYEKHEKWKQIAEDLETNENTKLSPPCYPKFLWTEQSSKRKFKLPKKENLYQLFTINSNESFSKIINAFTPEEVARKLSFKDNIRLAWRIMHSIYFNLTEEFDDERMEFSIHLLFRAREIYFEEWESDWRYDAFLGDSCFYAFRYHDRYYALKRAYEKEKNHPGLLLSFAHCITMPGDPLMTCEEAFPLAKKAMKDKLYADGVGIIQEYYSEKGDIKNFRKWRTLTKKLMEENAEESPHIEPEFLWEEEIKPSWTQKR